jgi:hypothetical protein
MITKDERKRNLSFSCHTYRGHTYAGIRQISPDLILRCIRIESPEMFSGSNRDRAIADEKIGWLRGAPQNEQPIESRCAQFWPEETADIRFAP